MKKIIIPTSKTKLLLIAMGSAVFVLLGFFLLYTAEDHHRYSPLVIRAAGLAGIFFFTITGTFAVKKIFDRTHGLVINEDGIMDYSGAIPSGLIKWSSIISVETTRVASTSFLLIHVSDSNEYLRQLKGWKRKLFAANLKMYNTPFTISATGLACTFNELEKLVQEAFHDYRHLYPAHVSISQQLLVQLHRAVLLAAQFTGGYSNNFLAAEDFCTALSTAVEKYAAGDQTMLNYFFIWFAPAGDWDDFTHHDGEELGNTIFSLVLQLRKEGRAKAGDL